MCLATLPLVLLEQLLDIDLLGRTRGTQIATGAGSPAFDLKNFLRQFKLTTRIRHRMRESQTLSFVRKAGDISPHNLIPFPWLRHDGRKVV